MSDSNMSNPAGPSLNPPPRRPFYPLPPVSTNSPSRTAPLYGLGWRSSYAKILRRHPVGCLGSVTGESILPQWFDLGYMERFDDLIQFDPCLVIHQPPEGDPNCVVCLIMFNTDAKSLEALSGPEGRAFVEAAKQVLQIDAQEEKSFMWYRVTPRYD